MRESGRVFTLALGAAWEAAGALTVQRREALRAHLRTVQSAGDPDKPGSYSWPTLRREAERRFAAGEAPAHVIDDLRRNHRDGPAMVPSVRTMRRWFVQGRWRSGTTSARQRVVARYAEVGTPSTNWEPMINLLLTGVAYPPRLAPVPARGPRRP
jgi:hypothetical protein